MHVLSAISCLLSFQDSDVVRAGAQVPQNSAALWSRESLEVPECHIWLHVFNSLSLNEL